MRRWRRHWASWRLWQRQQRSHGGGWTASSVPFRIFTWLCTADQLFFKGYAHLGSAVDCAIEVCELQSIMCTALWDCAQTFRGGKRTLSCLTVTDDFQSFLRMLPTVQRVSLSTRVEALLGLVSMSTVGLWASQENKDKTLQVKHDRGKESKVADKSRTHLMALILSESTTTNLFSRTRGKKSSRTQKANILQWFSSVLGANQKSGGTNLDPRG